MHMKQLKLLPLFLVVILFFGFSDSNQYEPIFMHRDNMESVIRLEGPRILENPGKIYIKGHYLFIVEKYLGIHVVDNINPETPDKVGFIHIDGCIDLAVKGNILYADNAVDLVALKFTEDFTSVEVVSRNKNVFPEFKSPNGRGLSWEEQQARPDNTVLVRWRRK